MFRFDAYDLGERSLAWIVENRELNAALVTAVRAHLAIEVLAPLRSGVDRVARRRVPKSGSRTGVS